MEEKTKTNIKTVSITEEGVNAMLEYEKKIIQKLSIVLSVILSIIVSVVMTIILTRIAK